MCFWACPAGGVLKAGDGAEMAAQPLILALANPTPEIMPEDALAVRPDAIIGTGRSDYPNQVNNVLCFPFIFRGALDVRRQHHQRAMKGRLRERDRQARREGSAERRRAGLRRRDAEELRPRLPDPQALRPAPDRGVPGAAVAKAAMESGVATRPIADLEAYRAQADTSSSSAPAC
jgi:malate dehydrogenase (oxaloacetate-decarboxylating)(NADP+)